MAKANYARKYTQDEVQEQDLFFESLYYRMRKEGADDEYVEAARTLWRWAMDETAKWQSAGLED